MSSANCLADQDVNDRALESGAQVGDRLPLVRRGDLREHAAHGGLQSAEAEIVIAGIEHAARKGEARRIARTRVPLDLWPARIAEGEHLRYLVEGFAGGVVHRAAEDAIIVHPVHFDEQRVPAADNQRKVRLDLVWRAEKRREQMTFEMIDGEVWFALSQRQALSRATSRS